MKLDDRVLAVLAEAVTEDDRLVLPGRMDRKLYVDVDKAIQAAGGKWNRYKKAHVFEANAAEAIEQVLLTGEITTHQDLNYFPTPAEIGEQMVDFAQLDPDASVLEPSAGRGALVRVLAEYVDSIVAVEQHEPFYDELVEARQCKSVIHEDFLRVEAGDAFDAVIMNPPFVKQADIHHVNHALDLVRPGGSLVSVMSNGVMFRDNHLTRQFRERIEGLGGYFEPLPDDAFKGSGTGVRTVLVVIEHMP